MSIPAKANSSDICIRIHNLEIMYRLKTNRWYRHWLIRYAAYLSLLCSLFCDRENKELSLVGPKVGLALRVVSLRGGEEG